MQRDAYRTPAGTQVPAVTAAEMRDVDRVAVDAVGLDVVRMMEHAGRGLAEAVLDRVDGGPVTIVAGNGGNGGGGLVCARHLSNRGLAVRVVLDRELRALDGVAAEQLRILEAMDVPVSGPRPRDLDGLLVDALIGYGLREAPRGPAATLIEAIGTEDGPVVSLDVPSGVDATTGNRPGVAVDPEHVVTLALPKTGLLAVDAAVRLLDLSIPATVYERLGLGHDHPFGSAFSVPIVDTADAPDPPSE